MVFLLPVVILFVFLYLLALLWLKLFHREGLGGGDVILIPAVGAFWRYSHPLGYTFSLYIRITIFSYLCS